MKEFALRLGTKLAIFLSLVIITVLSGYGYFHILSRQDMLLRKMKAEVRGIGETLRVSLERVLIPREIEYVQELIDAVEESEKTLGVIVYHAGQNIVFRSRSLEEDIEPYLKLIKKSIQDGKPLETFRTYAKHPVFTYSFPLKDVKKKGMGGVSVLQYTSFMEKDIRKAKWSIFIIIVVLIGGTVGLVLFATRRWVVLPISRLTEGIREMAKGNLSTRIMLRGGDELSDLATAFNQMAGDLQEAQRRIIRQAEAKLELERGLRRSEKLATIGQLSSGLAHEIGTPLNIVSGRAELLKKKLGNQDEFQRNLDIILQQVERITKIIQQLLGFVRKKTSQQSLVSIRTVLETILDLVSHEIRKQGATVNKHVEENLPPVKGDADQLQQVFLNLILNAIQSMPDGGWLRVSASLKRYQREGIEDRERQYVEVCVEDTGKGMEQEVIQNLFTPFYTTKDKGTGLGLTITHGIVEDHGGWIDVESEVGKGSLFKIYFPVGEEEQHDGPEV